MAIGLVTSEGKILETKEHFFSKADKENMENVLAFYIMDYLQKLLQENGVDWEQIEQIGIAVPGLVSNGVIEDLVNIPMGRMEIGKILSEEIKKKTDKSIPIKLKNDAKCAAIAEKMYGNMKNYEDAVFLCLGTGIGGAVFVEGELLEPKRHPGMEFGHMVIQKEGIPCNCGRKGCFERYAAMRVFREEAKKILKISENKSSEEIKKILVENKQKKEVKELIERYIRNLACGITNIICIFEPQIICIGGSFEHFADLLLEELKEEIWNKELTRRKEEIKIEVAKLGNDAGIIGAANL